MKIDDKEITVSLKKVEGDGDLNYNLFIDGLNIDKPIIYLNWVLGNNNNNEISFYIKNNEITPSEIKSIIYDENISYVLIKTNNNYYYISNIPQIYSDMIIKQNRILVLFDNIEGILKVNL